MRDVVQPWPTSRSIRVLWAASALGGFAQSLAGSAGALLARQIGGSDAVAGLPQTVSVIGAAISATLLSRLTLRRGRRLALSCGAWAAVVGCAAVMLAAVFSSLPLVLAGSVLLGAGSTTVMLGRYAAADLAMEADRVHSMATVLTVTTIGAVLGPNLLAPASGFVSGVGLPELSGPYLFAMLGFGAAGCALGIGLRAKPIAAGTGVAATSIRVAPDDGRHTASGFAVLVVANLVMVSVMTMAPVQLAHDGRNLSMIGLVISAHIAGMYAPSPLSGWLVHRIGGVRGAAVSGLALLAACVIAALGAADPVVLGAGMILLGVGWNLGLISGSDLLTAGVAADRRPRLEGIGELGMNAAAAGGGAVSGPVMMLGGYPTLAIVGSIASAFILPLLVHKKHATKPAGSPSTTV